jgi:hypothetical protein
MAIDPMTNGIPTYYIYTNGPQPVALSVSFLTNNGITPPPVYQDGLFYAQSLVPDFVPPMPDLVIEAVNVGPGGSSPVVTAEFKFQVGDLTINGNNAARFTVSDITTNVTLWYTVDGTTPTNAPPSIGPVAITNGNPVTLSINGSSNVLFQAIAFRDGFSPSRLAQQLFSPSNFVPNTISFGFASGEASSSFVASPGQTFYAPVTLSDLPGQKIYSLQFNLTVNKLGSAPPITPNAFSFQSMLLKPLPGSSPLLYIPIPPYMFVTDGPGPPPPATTNSIVSYEGNWFENLMFTNTANNLLGVGWMENYYQTNLYDTLSQDLITFSAAHIDFFPNAGQPNGVIVGGYSFQVPVNAAPGQAYQIQIGRPSATDDGIGLPGSGVFIYAPTNNSLGAGTLNALKNVTMGQIKYIVGDVYPFGWFNAGDFGTGDLITYGSADVEQVFLSAIYGVWYPPQGSDFFDAMDSCGATYVDLGHGYLEYNNPVNDPTALNALFDGNDTTINQIAFGDGVLDVCDVYVTYRRSLDPSLYWFQRFWTNGVRVAQIVPNAVASAAQQSSGAKVQPAVSANPAPVSITNTPSVNFAAGDYQAGAGSTVQIPVTATVFGQYPLRLLMLNLSVVPLDGSPPLTSPVQFTQNASVLGAPYTAYSTGNGNYSAVWLNSTNAGLSGTAVIGTLSITIPAAATSLSAYAIHFDHASASPSGFASFPKRTLTGLITLSSRANSTYNDGIPDSWRLRYFGTVNNLLSVSNADADGTPFNNWQKYIAGLDPTDPTSILAAGLDQPMAQSQQDSVISWPSVSGKQYVVERSATLFPQAWTPIYTNSGTGGYMEIHDSPTNKTRYYRVHTQ